MSLEGLFAIIALLVSLYALAQPIQRKTVTFFVPAWLIPSFLSIPAILVVWREILPLFKLEFLPAVDLGVRIITVFLPVGGVTVCMRLWQRARLSNKVDGKFRDLVEASINENRYQEVFRILMKNRGMLGKCLGNDTLSILVNKQVVHSLNNPPHWLQLDMLSEDAVIEELQDRFGAIDAVVRDTMKHDDSVLFRYVASSFGGLEFPFMHEQERRLIGRTFANPRWYIELRADYPLVMLACEALYSGNLDVSYNANGDLYSRSQGESPRVKCPIYLAIKIHFLALSAAVELDDRDYYVSDFWDIFHLVVNRSKYDQDTWENTDTNWEYPTPYCFLVKEILHDLRRLCELRCSGGQKRPGRIGADIIRIWVQCLYWLSQRRSSVATSLIHEEIRFYIYHILELKQNSEDANAALDKEIYSEWLAVVLQELKRKQQDPSLGSDLLLAMRRLDNGLGIVLRYGDWIETELQTV
jgi:hypothetical protein